MNTRMAFCPRCHKETVFLEKGNVRQCSACGAYFEQMNRPFVDQSSVGGEVMSFFQVLFRAVLIIIAIGVIGLGVLFAGCALMAGGFR